MLRALDPGRRANVAWGIVGALSVVGYEVSQAWHIAPGTFDWRDLLAQALGYALGWLAARAAARHDGCDVGAGLRAASVDRSARHFA
jgi:hypothetical protein